ncbi:MAG: hypothetical protein AB4426_20505 [Xenococcaceae cyanobacterium]
MIGKQLSLFDENFEDLFQDVLDLDSTGYLDSVQISILLSALVANAISTKRLELVAKLANQPDAVAIAQTFCNPKLVRELRLKRSREDSQISELTFQDNRVIYQDQEIGRTQILYKSPLPGELQARLAFESAIDRFLEYLQKRHQIVVLNESDYHVQVFIPSTKEQTDFSHHWREFIEEVAFSTYGDTKYQLPGLAQTFIVMLNTVTLAGRGFSTLDVPILTQDQLNVLVAWYLAVVQAVEKRQTNRQRQIDDLKQELAKSDLSAKERTSKEKDLQKKEEMQLKEAEKYSEYFQKAFSKVLEKQQSIWQDLEAIQSELEDSGLTKAQRKKVQKQQDKLVTQIILSQESVQQKLTLLEQSKGDPFLFIELDREQTPDKFKEIAKISKIFTKTATDQINSTRGDIFTQCILEMYRLLENKPRDPLPVPLLREQPRMMEGRSPGDNGKDFCYSCGVALNPKTAKWKVARFMFERPSQRCQSSSSEDRPYICASCSALAFASPLKVTDESVILKLEPANQNDVSKLKVKDYIRMLTNKEMHLSSGRYIVLTSDRTRGGDLASQKLGQVQYTLAKAASIFPKEVLTDFKFSLIIQGSQPKDLQTRHLIFIKGLMESYGQSLITSGKDVNLTLGDAVRYVEQDLLFLAGYTLVKISSISNPINLEQIRELYWQIIQQDTEEVCMSSDRLGKRAKLYRDVAALTGLTYAFAQSMESTTKKVMKPEDAEREVSKLIEQVDDAVAFCYYATLGDEKKTSVQARLYRNPDNYFVYEQTKELLKTLGVSEREETDKAGKTWLTLYADDVSRAYGHFADPNNEEGYAQEKDWKNLTYNLKLSLYTRFPELVRKLKSTSKK